MFLILIITIVILWYNDYFRYETNIYRSIDEDKNALINLLSVIFASRFQRTPKITMRSHDYVEYLFKQVLELRRYRLIR